MSQGICLECFCTVEGRAKYCTKCLIKRGTRNNFVNPDLVARSIREAREVDAPIRTDKLVDLMMKVCV